MGECRDAGVAVWVDEIQTFGRTGEIYAFHQLGLDDYVDVVTIGKMLHCAATLFTAELLPDPGLVSGTFAGSTVRLAVGRRGGHAHAARLRERRDGQ
jgi:4-aminobutyrate aminotransferase-like enzyme